MIRERVSVFDYRKICLENDFFIWNFLQRNQNQNHLSIWSIFDERKDDKKKEIKNEIKELLDIVPINYYESYVEESIDYLLGLGFTQNMIYEVPNEDTKWLVKREFYFKPMIILFKKFTPISSTQNYCYCAEGVMQMLIDHNPSIVSQINLD